MTIKSFFSGEKKVRNMLLTALVLISFGAVLALAGNTAFGTVTTKRIVIDTDCGASVSGTLYIPKGVSASNKAPAVFSLHGGSSSREVMGNYVIELARRGFVVFNCESWGNGDTEIDYTKGSTKASWYAMEYLKGLDYIDQDRIGMLSHSAGCSEISAVATGNDNEFNVKALMATGASYGKDWTSETAINLCLMVGWRDENHGTSRVMTTDAGHKAVWGTDDEIELGKWYGDLSNDTGRIMYAPSFMFHNLAKSDPRAMKICVDFFTTALDQPSNAYGQIWYFKTLGGVIACLGLFCGIIGFIEFCLEKTSFFHLSYEPKEVEAQTKKGPRYYILTAIVLIIGIFLAQKMFVNGDKVMRAISGNFKLGMINGAVFYFLVLGGVAFLINLGDKLSNRKYDWKLEASVYKAPVKDILKWILIALILFVLMLMLTLFLETYFGFHFNLILPELFVLRHQRLQAFATYILLFVLVQLLNQYCQVTSYRVVGGDDRKFYWTVLALNTVGAMGYVLIMILIKAYDLQIPNLAFFRLIGWTTPFARYNSILYYLSILNIFCSYVTVYCFKKTKKIYLGSFICALLLCWEACGNVLSA